MVALFVRLKLRLIANQLRGNVTQVLLLVLAAVFALGALVGVVAAAIGLRFADRDLAGAALVALGSLAVVAWAVMPVLLATEDDTSDPIRFALLPLQPRQLASGLLASSAVGFFPVATLAGALSTVVTWSTGVLPVVVALLSAPLGFATCMLASRAVVTVAAASLAGRRGRELVAGAGVLVFSGIGLLGPAIGWLGGALGTGGLDAAVRVLAWSPLGAPWSAPWAAAEGRPLAALGRLGIAVLTIAALWWVYTRALQRRIRPTVATGRGPKQRGRTAARRDLLPDSAYGALVQRCLRYWWRDSRYKVSVIALPVVVLILVLLPLQGNVGGFLALAAGPVVAALLSLTMLNELAFDGSALWTSLATGVRGRVERAARVSALLLWALPLTVAVAVGSTLVADSADQLPTVVGLSLALLLVGNGVGAVTSVWVPYPVPGPDENPFTSSSGGGMAGLLQQMVALLANLPLCLPVFALAIGAGFVPVLGWVLLVAGPVYGAVVLAVGIAVGGDRLDRTGPELLSRLDA